jgi:hypothetical protein
MIRSYLNTKGEGTCNSDFGTMLLRRWKASKRTVCKSPSYSFEQSQAGPTIGGRKSSIDCYGIKQKQHAGSGDGFCVMRNVAVNLGMFADEAFVQRNLEEYLSSRTTSLSQAYMRFPRGFVRGSCALEPAHSDSLWAEGRMPGWTADWTVRAFQSILDSDTTATTSSSNTASSSTTTRDSSSSSGDRAQQQQVRCDAWVEQDTMVVQRDTFANLFHVSEDFINAFLVMGILQWSLNGTQVLVTDMYPQGPYW